MVVENVVRNVIRSNRGIEGKIGLTQELIDLIKLGTFVKIIDFFFVPSSYIRLFGKINRDDIERIELKHRLVVYGLLDAAELARTFGYFCIINYYFQNF